MEKDVTKQIVATQNFANMPKNTSVTHKVLIKVKNVSNKICRKEKAQYMSSL
jgi:hypothetical protein